MKLQKYKFLPGWHGALRQTVILKSWWMDIAFGQQV
jgi:hypothetical protein